MFTNREDFLLDALDYYTADTNRRCVSDSDGCYYNPTSAGKEGISEGCLIGRHLTKEQQIQADNTGGVLSIFNQQKANEILPEWMHEFGELFLFHCQQLHDGPILWNDGGLTDEGRNRLSIIIKDFELDPTKFEKYL